VAKADDVADYVYSNLQETWRQFLAGTVLDAESLVVIESESPLNLKSGSPVVLACGNRLSMHRQHG
jgi:hypothetical protein